MEPTHKEKQSKRAAELLLYVYKKIDQRPPLWVEEAAVSYYSVASGYHDNIVALCELLKALTDERREEIVYGDPKDPECRRLADWWEGHKKDDRRREKKEEQDSLREKALAKLTKEEREALGLHWNGPVAE